MWKPRNRGFSDLMQKDTHKRSSSSITQLTRKLVLVIIAILTSGYFLYRALLQPHSRFVIILASNQGGGVIGWKGPQEWAIEKNSIKNKRSYVARHGYTLAVKDMSMRKKYAHEWRESWEKVDIIKETMRENPHAEWFWWLDLSTHIMEPSISLEKHLFGNLEHKVYRNLSDSFNPLNFTIDSPFITLDREINMIVPQDCGGFNLGSFFIRRSEWSERLLDQWWDPVFYEQRHMQWDHKEQDAFENLFSASPWIRNSVAFVENKAINSFPPGACAEQADDKQFFYAEGDFAVNMAGCQYGRNCYDEMRYYRELSEKRNKRWFSWN